MKTYSHKDKRDNILHILVNKYQIDPERFRSYLPELIPEIEDRFHSFNKKGHISTLTEIERERLCKLLLKLPRDKSITEEQAIQALGYCATLIQDENLPNEIDRKTILTFLHRAIGTPLSKIDKITEKSIGNRKAVKTIAVLRGVYLHLTWDDLLAAISISPTKFKERSEALRFVGIGQDSLADVSRQHNHYFGESVKCHYLEE
jgi:hypothetical protein